MNIIFSNYGVYKDYINEQVEKYNREHSEYFGSYKDLKYDDFGFFAVDESDDIFGAIIGRVKLNWAHIDILWIDEELRNNGYSSALLAKAIDFAKEKNCIGIRTETFDKNAKEFYEYLGFKVVGEIKDFPPGHTEYILAKKI